MLPDENHQESTCSAQNVGLAIGVVFLIHAALSLVMSRGRHLSWVIFLAISVLSIYATRT